MATNRAKKGHYYALIRNLYDICYRCINSFPGIIIHSDIFAIYTKFGRKHLKTYHLTWYI